jgi:RNA recognition motif-containing protein
MPQNLYVCNVDYSVNAEQLKKLFSQYGEVHSAKIITNRETGQSRGFGFVSMDTQDAENAMQHLNNKDFEGRPLVVKHALDKN